MRRGASHTALHPSGWMLPTSRRDPNSLAAPRTPATRRVRETSLQTAQTKHHSSWLESTAFLKRKNSLMIDCVFASSSHLLLCNIDICLSTKTPSVLQTRVFSWRRRGECFDWLHLLSVCALSAHRQLQDRQTWAAQRFPFPEALLGCRPTGSNQQSPWVQQEPRQKEEPDVGPGRMVYKP